MIPQVHPADEGAAHAVGGAADVAVGVGEIDDQARRIIHALRLEARRAIEHQQHAGGVAVAAALDAERRARAVALARLIGAGSLDAAMAVTIVPLGPDSSSITILGRGLVILDGHVRRRLRGNRR